MAPLFRLPIRRRVTRELDEELEFHLDMRTAELVAQGWSPGAARAEARRQFGDLEDARAFCRQADTRRENRLMRTESFAELRQDFRFALRTLRRSPGFTALAALTLALGIGANTAIFSVVRGILIRPLPFAEPAQLVMIGSTYEGSKPFPYASPPNILDWKAGNRTLSALSYYADQTGVLTDAGEPEELPGAAVSADFFETLGIPPIVGRLRFSDEEAAFQGPQAIILGETVWRNRFGADPGVVGRPVTIDGTPWRVVGVAPARSTHPAGTAFWVPQTFDPARLSGSRGAVYLTAIGRLRPGVTVEAADADIAAIATRLAQEYPDANARMGTKLVPLHEWTVGSIDTPLLILLGGVGFVLLIACANVANLLLVRGAARGGELAVRTALGAGRGRLVRQLATESMVLALIGVVVGVGLGAVGVRALLRIAPASLPRLGAVELDGLVLAFAAGLSLLTGLGFGLLPARLLTRGDLATTLRDGGRSGSRRAGTRARRGLVVAEVALAVMLLAGAGLLIRSFGALTSVDPGFRSEGSVSFGVSLPQERYPLRSAQQIDFVRTLMDRLETLPGVDQVGAATGMPLTSYNFTFSFQIAGRPVAPGNAPSAQVRVATTNYLRTMGIPVRAGRGFTTEDRAGGRVVLLVNEAAARRFFPGEDPIGHHISIGWGGLEGDIVGVVADTRPSSLAAPPAPTFWIHYDQRPVGSVRVVMHGSGNPRSLIAAATRVVHEIDPALAVSQVATLDEIVARSVAQPRFYMALLTGFAVLAIVLSAVGIYGVVGHLVAQRSREIGTRMALGASKGSVVGMVLREGTGLAIGGLAIGVAGALALNRLLAGLLFQIRPTDPVTYGAVVLALVAIALSACWLPARRAAAVSPATTMRTE